MRSILAYWHMLHPYTSAAVAVVAMLLARLPGESMSDARISLIGLTMLLVQFSIGLSNDLLDQTYDAVAKPQKPLIAGLSKQVPALVMLGSIVVTAWYLGFQYGALAFGILLVGQACGLVYNLGLKRTAYSWIPHAVAAPTILVWVRTINGTESLAMWWAYPLGLLLGPALNIANQLQGAEAAEASGERSLVQFWGVSRAGVIASALFALSALMMLAVVHFIGGNLIPAQAAALVAGGPVWLFVHLVRKDARTLLWPLALIIGGTLGLGFHLSLPA